MSKRQGKGVKYVMKGSLSDARKMVHPREDGSLLLGVLIVGADRVSC
jgi:hypothetical protein